MTDLNTPAVADDVRVAILDALGLSLATKRVAAMSARAASGIEDEWIGDEEFYQGYDDANRGEFVRTANKPLTSGDAPVEIKGSTVFPNITASFCDAAAARVGDMLLPTDDRNFALEPTPIPDILPEDEPPAPVAPAPPTQQAAQPMPGQPPMGAPAEAGMPPMVAPGQPQPAAPMAPSRMITMPDGMQMTLDEARKRFDRFKAEAQRKADKAQTRIDDWLTECQIASEMRKVIDDAAKLGSGCIKGPVPINRKSRQWRTGEDGVKHLMLNESNQPGSRRIDVWNLFPDEACGESIHNGSHIFERDYLTPKKLKNLKGNRRPNGDPLYLDSQIDACLEEGPRDNNGGNQGGAVQRNTKGQFEIWYFHGEISTDEMEAAGCSCEDMEGDRKDSYPCLMTMVNDRVIQASLNPLDDGEFPYDVIPWKRRPGMPWGMGVARQMRTPQRIVVAAARNLMDNAGQAGGPQFVVGRGVEPKNGKWEIKPLKIWVESDDSDGRATPPFVSVVVPMLQVELTSIIQLGMKMAEDVTGMPQLTQGNQGSAPDTVGGMQILNANANAVLRRISRLFDSCITEPHIRRYYAWLMEYGPDDDEKGDFQIVARGSTALVERDIQTQEMANIVGMCLNPAFGKNPAKAMDEFLKSRRFDPSAFDFTDEEKKENEAKAPMPMPQVEVAKIRAESAEKIEQMQAKEEADHAAADAQLAMAQQQFEARENELDRQNKLAVAVIDERMQATDLTSTERQTLDKIKAGLAQTSMKLNVQKDLSTAGHLVDVHKHRNPTPQVITPPTEPAGRAPDGKAFQA